MPGELSRRNKGKPDPPPNGKKASLKDTFGHKSNIPWTEEETEHVQELMEYLTVQLKEQEGTHNLPPDESFQLLTTLQQFLRQDDLDRNDPLLSKIAYYFNDVKCVDLHKVATMLKANKKVGDDLEDQDVILLLGNASSGKTTTLHCLAGTTFKEVVVDGFVHLKPTQYLDAAVAGFETSCTRGSVTKGLQTVPVEILDEKYVVCDTPALDLFDSVEEEIAHRHGVIENIGRARKVRPVFVLSQECLGNRMSGLHDVISMIASYFNSDALMDYETLPFQYVFTRFGDRHRARLWKMLKFYRDTTTASGFEGREMNPELFEKVINDMIQKTNPEANLVSPVTDIPRYLLRSLIEEQGLFCEPQTTLREVGFNSAWNLLHIQLKLTLYGIMMFLATQDFQAAVEGVQNLSDLSGFLPAAKEYFDVALKACERYAIVLWESFNISMDKQDFISALVHVHQSLDLSVALPEMDDNTRLSYEKFWHQFRDRAIKSEQTLPPELVLKLRDITTHSFDMHGEIVGGIRGVRAAVLKEVNSRESFEVAVPQLKLLLQLSSGFPEAANACSDLLDPLEVRIMERVREKDFRKSTEDLVALGALAREFPDRLRFCHHALKLYKHAMDHAIDKHVFEQAGNTMLYLAKLQENYPDAERVLQRGLEKLWKRFGSAIKEREYATAVSIVKYMSKLAHFSTNAYERSRLAIEVMRDRLMKSIATKNYGMAQVLMQQLTRLEKGLPQTSHMAKVAKVAKVTKANDDDGEGDNSHGSGSRGDHHGHARDPRNKTRETRRRKSRSPSPARHKDAARAPKKSSRDMRQDDEEEDDYGHIHVVKHGRSGRKAHRAEARDDFEGDFDYVERHDDFVETPGLLDEGELPFDMMSELTMSIAAEKRAREKRHKKKEYAYEEEREQHPPPLSRIGPSVTQIAKEKLLGTPPRKKSQRHKKHYESPSPPRKSHREAPPRKSRDETTPPRKSRYESPAQRKSRREKVVAKLDHLLESPRRKSHTPSPPRRKSSPPSPTRRVSNRPLPPESPPARKSRTRDVSRYDESPAKLRQEAHRKIRVTKERDSPRSSHENYRPQEKVTRPSDEDSSVDSKPSDEESSFHKKKTKKKDKKTKKAPKISYNYKQRDSYKEQRDSYEQRRAEILSDDRDEMDESDLPSRMSSRVSGKKNPFQHDIMRVDSLASSEDFSWAI